MRLVGRSFLGLIFSIGLIGSLNAQDEKQSREAKLTPEQLDFFESKIRPLLVENCYNCHSSQGQGTRGGLAVDSREGLHIGGESGPAIVPGNLEESLLWNAVNYKDLRMPPRKPLSPQAIEDIRQWIVMGAPDPRSGQVAPVSSHVTDEDIERGREFWSFKLPKLEKPKTLLTLSSWPKSEIDQYVATGLEQHQLTPSPDTSASQLLRRIYFDLVGLPPLPEDLVAFEKDFAERQEKAIEHVVDRLLDSPQYGERWARHWLDVARYAESTGKEFDSTFPHAWRYRDYVIDSFQSDKPYNEFIQEQVAGDLLPAKTDEQWQENLIATGFLAIGPKALLEQNPRQFQADLVDEQIDTVSRVVLGVSVACARCHDHKFDPIRQTDYYAMAGIFQSTETFFGGFRSQRNRQPSGLIALPINDLNPNDQPVPPTELASLRERVRELEVEQMQARRMAFAGNNKPGNNSNSNQKDSDNNRNNNPQPNNNFAKAFVNQAILEQQIVAIKARINSVDEQGKPLTLCMGVQDRDRIGNARLLERGEIDRQAQEVERGFVQLLSAQPAELSAKSSGRLELARWLTSESNPLTARVMVNRIWQHLIGNPLVTEPDNFGMSGPGTKQQALLDYMSIKFVAEGWSVKKMIRSIVLSRVYRLSSEVQQESFEKDPDNEYLARGNRKRLDAEALRDSMLTISGQIDFKRPRGSLISNLGVAVVGPNGPVAPVMAMPTKNSASDDDPNSSMMNEDRSRMAFRMANNGRNPLETPVYYRSVYLPIARNLLPRSLDVFNFAEPSMVVTIREQASTADQALYLLNNEFVLTQSDSIARRVFREREKPAERLQLLFSLMFGRKPTQEEVQLSMSFLRDATELAEGRNSSEKTFSAWSQLCQSLMATAEFRWLN